MRKKLLMLFATGLMLCASVFGATACGEPPEPPHTHAFDKQVVSDDYLKEAATCTDKAEYYYSCECGEKGTETFETGEALGHAYGSWTSNGDGTHSGVCANDNTHTAVGNCNGGTATCTSKAVCKDCGAEYGELASHVFDQKKVDAKYLKTPATCEGKAVYYYSCICGEKGTETFEDGEAINHNYGAWVSNGDGTHTKTCANDATHKVTEDCNGGTATCTNKAVCKDCGAEYGEKSTNHLFNQEVVKAEYLDKAATCETKATYFKSCVCGAKGTETFETGEALGHAYGACVSNGDGTHTKTCANDATHKVTEDCNGGTATCLAKAVCKDCGAEYGEKATDHTYNQEVVKAEYLDKEATCETKATYFKSCVCGAKGTETFETGEALGHEYANWTSNGDDTHTGTCLNDASHTTIKECNGGTATCEGKAECDDCGAKYGEALGHQYANWTSNGDDTHTGTCVNDASHTTVEECNGGTATCTQKALCDDCGAEHGELSTEHNYDQEVVKAEYLDKEATCETKATYFKSCVCGAKGTETFETGEALGHEYANWTSNGDDTHTGTCLNDASHTTIKECNGGTDVCEEKATCVDCGAEYGEILDHAYGEWICNGDRTHTHVCDKNATHTETFDCSYEAGVCTVCEGEMPTWSGNSIKYSTLDEKVYIDEELKALGIVSILDVADESVSYYDGTTLINVPANLDSKDLTDYTKKAIVKLADGAEYLIDVISYTKVLTTSSDFALFKGEAEATISGYYIMNNDIKLDGTWAGNTANSDKPHTFKGVFDGNGHVAEIALKRYGVFGTMSGAEFKNAAFIVKQIGVKDFAYASILAYKITNTTISNSYFAYDLPEGTKVDVSYYGYGQTAGLGLYTSAQVGVIYQNVIIDTSKVETECVSNEQPYAYGSIISKANGSSGGVYLTRTSDTYVISDYKYLSYLADVTSSGNSITAFNGIQYAQFASNDTEAYNNCTVTGAKHQIPGTYRYDAYGDMPTTASAYSTFDANVWDLTNGYPIFKACYNEVYFDIVASATTYSIGGSQGNEAGLTIEEGSAEMPTLSDITATFKGTNYTPSKLEIVAGETVVTTSGNVITATGVAGVATVKATFEIQGLEIEKNFIINVSLVGSSLKGVAYYSSLDNEFILSSEEYAGLTVSKVVDLEGNELTADDISNQTNAKLTKQVTITLSDDTTGAIDLICATKVINGQEDLGALVDTTKADANGNIKGYFVVANSFEIGAGYTPVTPATVTFFAGTLDGQGNTISNLIVGEKGLLCGVGEGGKMVNLKLHVKEGARFTSLGLITTENEYGSTYDAADETKTFVVDNCYFDIDSNWTGDDSGALFSGSPYLGLRMSNSIIDVKAGIFTKETELTLDNIKRGIVFNNISRSHISSDVDGHKWFGKRDSAVVYDIFKDCYFISEDYGFIVAQCATSGKRAIVCENDITLEQTVKNLFTNGVGLAKGINRYADINSVPNTDGVIGASINWKVVDGAIVWNA